ncbi:class III signal peptide-containing protein [Methanotorris formicicus]|uniref:Class III signal peptide-containing protein n=1 Tax=Methanotorris formicicus Mc-S-70 TaxID=647171 RepID=H1KYY3_9EURY|nr:class III signal peptide-containing protein [Methanotorris formicicus]EHP86563.1 protein of unknown function DUF361 [Methanotorris formicicus Mc-S-70]
MPNFIFNSKMGQTSIEFSILLLIILVIVVSSITNVINGLFNEEERTIDKIDISAKTAVSLVNSHYNGTYANETLTYAGMYLNETSNEVIIYIVPDYTINENVKNFIVNYIHNYINNSKYIIKINK